MGPNRRIFIAAAIFTTLASAGVAVILQFNLFGSVNTAIDDIGEAVAAFLAAGASVWAARRATGVRLRRAWTLMSLSALAWAIGETVWSVYEVGLGVAVPYPSAADAGFLAAVPLALAAVVLFWKPGRGFQSSWRVALDAATVLVALLFTAWAFGLRTVWLQAGDSLFDKLIGLAYPVGDILVGTVLILGIRRATHSQEGRMLLLLAGLAANALADSAFAYLTAAGNYNIHGSVLDTGWVLGYLLIALAALWPAREKDVTKERSPYDVWQLALPWIA